MSFGGVQGQQTKKVADDGRMPFDFTGLVGLTETLSAPSVTAVVYSGVDPTPQNIVSGAAVVSGKIVTQLIIDGIAGCIYEITCGVNTSLGQRLNISSYLAVVPNVV